MNISELNTSSLQVDQQSLNEIKNQLLVIVLVYIVFASLTFIGNILVLYVLIKGFTLVETITEWLQIWLQ